MQRINTNTIKAEMCEIEFLYH